MYRFKGGAKNGQGKNDVILAAVTCLHYVFRLVNCPVCRSGDWPDLIKCDYILQFEGSSIGHLHLLNRYATCKE